MIYVVIYSLLVLIEKLTFSKKQLQRFIIPLILFSVEYVNRNTETVVLLRMA